MLLFKVILALSSLTIGQMAAAVSDCKFRNDPIDVLRGAGCQIEQISDECKNWFKENPETLEFAANCEDPAPQESLLVTCGIDAVNAWIDVFKDYGKNYALCEKNISIKRRLARESFYSFKDDNDLIDDDAPTCQSLAIKRENVRSMAERDPAYRQMLIGKSVPLPGLTEEPPGESRSFEEALYALATDQLNKLSVKWQCYSAKAKVRMACTALGTVADPTLLIGAAGVSIKGGKWVVRALKPSSSAWKPFFKPKLAKATLDEGLKVNSMGNGSKRLKVGSGGEGDVFAVVKVKNGSKSYYASKHFGDKEYAAEIFAKYKKIEEMEKKGYLGSMRAVKPIAVRGGSIDLELVEGRDLLSLNLDPNLKGSAEVKALNQRYVNSLNETKTQLERAGYFTRLANDSHSGLPILTVADTPIVVDDGGWITTPFIFSFEDQNVVVDAATGQFVLIDPH